MLGSSSAATSFQFGEPEVVWRMQQRRKMMVSFSVYLLFELGGILWFVVVMVNNEGWDLQLGRGG